MLARNPTCVSCHTNPATHADHIDPDGRRFDLRNGQGLCHPCHSRKTAAQDGGYGNPKQTSTSE